MARKLTFDRLPDAVAKILEILGSEESEHTMLPEVLSRLARVEKKLEYLQIIASPDKPVMDMQTVCKVLRLRPKAVSELANRGVLPSREQGRKTVFYEEGVVRYFASLPAWKEAVTGASAAAEKPARGRQAAVEPAPVEPADQPAVEPKPAGEPAKNARQRVDIHVAAEILGRSLAAVYQLTSSGRVPFHKEGTKVFFHTDELRAWAKVHPPRPKKAKK